MKVGEILDENKDNGLDIARKIIKINMDKEWEFRLFKKSVRKFVSEDIYKNISNEFNRQVTEYRSNGTR
jgi:hypothetical protein